MSKFITVLFVVCPIAAMYFMGLSIGIFMGSIFLLGVGMLLIYTYPAFVAQKQLYAYEMESNIINVLEKASFDCDVQYGWLNAGEIFDAVNILFNDKVEHSDQFFDSFQRLKKIKVIIQKRIEAKQQNNNIDRVYRLNEHSKYRPKKPRRLSKKRKSVCANHASA